MRAILRRRSRQIASPMPASAQVAGSGAVMPWVRRDTSSTHTGPADPAEDGHPDWCTDGSLIAFRCGRGPAHFQIQIYVIGAGVPPARTDARVPFGVSDAPSRFGSVSWRWCAEEREVRVRVERLPAGGIVVVLPGVGTSALRLGM